MHVPVTWIAWVPCFLGMMPLRTIVRCVFLRHITPIFFVTIYFYVLLFLIVCYSHLQLTKYIPSVGQFENLK